MLQHHTTKLADLMFYAESKMWCSLVMFTGHLSTETYIIVARRIHSTLTTSNRALRHIKVPTRADWLRILNSIFRRVLILSGFTFDIRVTSAVWFSVQHANLCNVGGNVIRSGFRGQKTSEGEMSGGICPGECPIPNFTVLLDPHLEWSDPTQLKIAPKKTNFQKLKQCVKFARN